MTPAAIAAQLDETLENARLRMRAISEAAAGTRPAPHQWSKKEILGHLIDSAANNHQRFVRLQIEDGLVLPSYQQNKWVCVQNYGGRGWHELIELWLAYNRHLAHVMRHSDVTAARHIWKAPGGDHTLEFLIEDYLRHLRHHLAQILDASAVD
jgi:hypothetical protein